MSRRMTRRLWPLLAAALAALAAHAYCQVKTVEVRADLGSGPGAGPSGAGSQAPLSAPAQLASQALSGSLSVGSAPKLSASAVQVPALAAPAAPTAAKSAPEKKSSSVERVLEQAQRVNAEIASTLKRPGGGDTSEAKAAAAGANLFDAGTYEPSQGDQELIQLRERVDRDAQSILANELGGSLERSSIGRRVHSVLLRLEKANGIDSGAVNLHLGSSMIPNAFTTITDTELTYLKNKGRLQATFKNSNVFLSRGLLESYLGQPDAALAFVIAHELAHNRLGHLKSLGSSSMMLGHLLEFEADTEALSMLARAGYDPREALNSLDLIEARVEALKKDYPLLQRGQSEYQQLLMRWRDVHPNNAMRRANLEDHLTRALEVYQSSPMKERPQRALAGIAAGLKTAPVRDEAAILEEHLGQVIADPKLSFYDKVVAMEGAITQRIRERQVQTNGRGRTETQRYVAIEDQMIVENAVRALAAKA